MSPTVPVVCSCLELFETVYRVKIVLRHNDFDEQLSVRCCL